jgi:hypothetical protein
MKRFIILAATTLALAAGVVSAQASCGDYAKFKPGSKHTVVTLPTPPMHEFKLPGGTSIVGMWQLQYSSGGNPLFQSFEQWHSDGLEFEFADIPTIPGDICMGVWSQSGKKVSLYHTAWTFDDNGNPSGTMVLTHLDKVAKDDNSFAGTFDLKFYDLNGNLINEIDGDVAGARISAP